MSPKATNNLAQGKRAQPYDANKTNRESPKVTNTIVKTEIEFANLLYVTFGDAIRSN